MKIMELQALPDNIVFQWDASTVILEYLLSLPYRYAIITNAHIHSLYAEELHNSILAKGIEASIFSFPAGERSKTRETKELIENQMFEKKWGRDTCVIAIGGGVVTDLAGFLAATYCRGIPLILIPTSLVGMIDAGIGGKNGVNTIYGKNLIGTFYEPLKIFVDPKFLKTLPENEMVNGIVEMMKHGLIADGEYFYFLKQNFRFLLAQEENILEKVIVDSCRIKCDIVKQDKKDHGIRHLLNFGHTIGHAIEKLVGFSMSHGQAVAVGILVESEMARQLGLLSSSCFDDIVSFVEQLQIPLESFIDIEVSALIDCLGLDKKSIHSQPRFVLLTGIGKCMTRDHEYVFFVDETIVIDSLERVKNTIFL